MAEDKSTWEQLLAMRAQWAQEQPSLGAELKAMAREGIKDVRSTVKVDRKTSNAMATTFLGGLLVALGAILFSMFGGKSKSA